MKKVFFAVAAAVVTGGMMVSSVAAQDPVLGMWQTEVDDGAYAHVSMYECADKFCGTIAKTFNDTGQYQSENLGKMIVINMVAEGEGSYDGSVFRPSNGKTYVGGIELNGNVLRLAGCVLGGLICAKQTWTRLP
jgi:uncharacterized protein (DUF2147 family)